MVDKRGRLSRKEQRKADITSDDLVCPTGGRPPAFDAEKDRQLKAICRLKPTLKDCGAFLNVATTTVEEHIKRTYGLNFPDFRDRYMVHTRFNIVRKIIQKCEDGDNQMLIWGSKNLCKWSDKQETTVKGDEEAPLTLAYSLNK